MNFIFRGEIIDYDFFKNNNKPNLIFLHGWGGNKFSFSSSINLLKKDFSILTLTMPTVSNMNLSWSLFDYANLIEQLCCCLNIKSASIICHSFGFRVATVLKHKIKISKLVVTGGAGMKKVNFFKQTEINNNQLLLRNRKFKFLYNNIASKDYVDLSPINKMTFKNIVNFNTINLTKFNCPMLLFWGRKDTETPVWMAKKLRNQNNAKLILTEEDHFAYIKNKALFNKELVRFLK